MQIMSIDARDAWRARTPLLRDTLYAYERRRWRLPRDGLMENNVNTYFSVTSGCIGPVDRRKSQMVYTRVFLMAAFRRCDVYGVADTVRFSAPRWIERARIPRARDNAHGLSAVQAYNIIYLIARVPSSVYREYSLYAPKRHDTI